MSTKRPLPPLPNPRRNLDEDEYEVPVSAGLKEHTYQSIYECCASDPERNIIVEHLPDSLTEQSVDTLILYFESKKHFGRYLSVEEVSLDEQKKEAVVTFKTSADAKHVLETHKKVPCQLQGKKLIIRPMVAAKRPKNEEDSGGNYSDTYESMGNKNDTVEVCGFSKDTSEDLLEMYFENENRSGGGAIKEFNFDSSGTIAIITFENPAVALRVLKRKHEVQKCKLEVKPHAAVQSPSKVVEKSPHKTETDTIEVRGFKSSTSSDTLRYYFENEKRSGGGELKDFSINREECFALMTYKDPEVALRVLKQKHEVQKCKLKVKLHTAIQSPSKVAEKSSHKTETDTIEVRGFKSSTSSDTLRYYFENEKRSGGGELKDFSINREECFALMTYKDPEVVERVLGREHKVDKCKLTLRPFVISKRELVLLEVSDTFTEEDIENFLEAKLHVEITGVVFNHDKSKVFVQSSTPFDMDEVNKACNEHQICGTNLLPRQVPVSNGIVAFNLPDDVTKDTLEFYFDNSRKSGGEGVEKVDDHFADGYCIIYFKDVEVVSRVCEKEIHQPLKDKEPIKVKPYNPFFGLPAGCEISTFKLPEPVCLEEEDAHKLKFLKENKAQREKLTKNLNFLYADIAWEERPVTVHCTLTIENNQHRHKLKTWREDVTKLLKDFIDVLAVKKKDIDVEMWVDVSKAIREVHLKNPDGVALIVEKENSRLVVVAHVSMIEEAFKQIELAVNQAEKVFRDRKSTKAERKELDSWKVRFLKAAGFQEEMQSTHENVKIDFDEKKGKCLVIIEGPAETVQTVLLAMYERLQGIKSSTVELCQEKISILSNNGTKKYVDDKMKRENLPEIWELKKGGVDLYADEFTDLRKMENVIKNSVVQFSVELDSGAMTALKSDKWKETQKTLRKNNDGCIEIKQNGSKLEIFARADKGDSVSKELENFISTNAVYKEEVPETAPVIMCFQRFLKSDFDQQLIDLQKHGDHIKITFDDQRMIAVLEGTADGVKKGKSLLKKLQDRVKSETQTIKHRKVRTFLGLEQGRECIRKVETNVPCVIDLGGSGFKTSMRVAQLGQKNFDKITECAEATLEHGVKITVVGGDITEVKAEVLVNAANKEMKHVGGLAAAIIRKGGNDIQKECEDRIKREGSLADGDVYLSKGGNLQCSFIAHAVGPHWSGGSNNEETTLQRAVIKCLEKTEKNKATSIAMPALSAGMFGYPIDQACLAIVKALLQHFQSKGKKTKIKNVMLCDISQLTVGSFTTALQKVFGDVKVMVNVSAAGGPKPSWVHNTDEDKDADSHSAIEIEVARDILAKEQVDVIVNSTSPDLKMDRGALSKSLLKAGGDVIQQECDQNYPNGITLGEVAVTGGGNLACSKIFHISLKHFDKSNPRQSLKGIESCIRACLEEADQQGFTSVSFPAMGTGAQRYPRDKVATEMFKTVTSFSKATNTTVRSVRFVIFTEDDETFEAFLTEEKNWKSNQPRPFSERRSASSGSARRQDQPGQGELLRESSGEAKFRFENLKMSVHHGDITEEDTEAIVASCNLDLDLSKGAVTKALVKKGGSAIEQACKQEKDTMRKDGIAITTAGKLKTKYIIHVDTKYKTWEWKPVVLMALQKAEKHKLTSVAFPALGTSVGSKPEELACVMHASIVEFNKDKPKHLKKVKVVVFQRDMVPKFIEGMKNAISGRPGSGDRRPRDEGRQSRSRGHHERYQKHPQSRGTDQEDSCTVIIYAEGSDKVQRAKNLLDKSIENDWGTKKIEDQCVHRLSPKHIKELKAFAANKHVEMSVDTDMGVIELVGLYKNISELSDNVFGCLRSADKSFYLKGQAQLMASIVKWYYLKDNKEQPFPTRINLEIETAFKGKQKQINVKDNSGGEYVIDFAIMEEHDVKNPGSKFSVIRRDMYEGASFEIPKNWQKMGNTENLKLVALDQRDAEYKKVLSEFSSTLGRNPNIVQIERIQNKTLYTQYCAKRKEMNNNNPKQKNERVLWHGTDENAVPSINAHGFNRSYCGKNATAIGEGVYFAVQSAYSDQGTYSPNGRDGNKRMYRCLVLTGKCCPGRSGMRVPPPIDQSKPHIQYDSVTNNTSSPGMFVIFNDTQAYPEHLITYR